MPWNASVWIQCVQQGWPTSKVTCKSFSFSCQELTQPSPSPPLPLLSSRQPDIHLNESFSLWSFHWTADRMVLLVSGKYKRLNALMWTLGHKFNKLIEFFLETRPDDASRTSAKCALSWTSWRISAAQWKASDQRFVLKHNKVLQV